MPPTNFTPPPGSKYVIVGKPRPYVAMLIHGETGAGKTAIPAFYCPDPVHIINFDGRAENTVKKALDKGRRVLLAHLPCPIGNTKLPPEEIKRIARTTFDDVLKQIEISIREAEKGNCRTIAIDTGTELSDIMSLSVGAKFAGEATGYEAVRIQGSVNLLWRKLFVDLKKVPCHTVILSRTKEIWAGDGNSRNATGNYEPRIAKGVEEGIEVSISVRKAGTGQNVKWNVKVTNPKLMPSEMGATYNEEMWGPMGPFLFTCLMQGVAVDPTL